MVEYVIHATHECVIHEKCGHRLIGPDFYYDELRKQICNSFELPPSAPFQLSYEDWNSEFVSLVNAEELDDALHRQKLNPLQVKVVQKCSSPIVKVLHGDTHHLLTLPPSQLEFCYEQFHGRVRKLFNFPSSAQFLLTYKEPDFGGPRMTIASDEELNYALVKESPNPLRLDVTMIEVDNEKNISDRSPRKTSSDLVEMCHNDALLNLDDALLSLTPSELGDVEALSCEQVQMRIRDVLKLPTQFELSYVDKNGDNITIVNGENLKDAFSQRPRRPLQLSMTQNTSSDFVVKVQHLGTPLGTFHRLILSPDENQFSYEKFRSRVRGLLDLLPSNEFVLTYVDEDDDTIAIFEDEDLRDALVLQSLHPLKVFVTMLKPVSGAF